MNLFDEALSVAVEHVIWCRKRGMGAHAILQSIGVPVSLEANPSWDDTVWIVARRWSMFGKQRIAA